MLRLFRKIRFQLLGENKILRYLAYAVGEILLVVIGILIALQVNNWNLERKDRESEMLILQEIHADLSIDLEEFDRNIGHLENQQVASLRMLEIVREDQVFDPGYGFYYFHFQLFPRFTPKTGGYQLLQTKGLDLISDNSLRRAITDLYEFGYPYIQAKEADLKSLYANQIAPFTLKYNGTESPNYEDKPADLNILESRINPYVNMRAFEAFKKDQDFHGVIKFAETDGGSYLFSHEYSVREIKALMEKLEAELK